MTAPYPDFELIECLRKKFVEFSVDNLTRDEVIDLINHMYQAIQVKDREIIELRGVMRT
jgi:hypothetical protein